MREGPPPTGSDETAVGTTGVVDPLSAPDAQRREDAVVAVTHVLGSLAGPAPSGRARPGAKRSKSSRGSKRRGAAPRAARGPLRPAAPTAGAPSDPALAALEEIAQTPLGRIWMVDPTSGQALAGAEAPRRAAGVVAPMPRRRPIVSRETGEKPPQAPKMALDNAIDVPFFLGLGRIFIWLWGVLRFAGGTFVDILKRRNSEERRAVRFRQTLERLGPTFVKLGQQLSVRADVLPYKYCEELAKMLDAVPPFPTEKAIAIVEKSLGRPLGEVFAIFDPKPIGSASLACVYQAVLHSGERVAVKVQRPRVGEILAADLDAMSRLLRIAELLSLIRDGMTRNLRYELRSMFMEEVDYHREARYCDIFRTRAEKKGIDYVTAPRVFFDLSSREVLVTEFVSGVFLWEVLAAVERGDQPTLDALAQFDIDPKVVAARMVHAFNWETIESILFHADPHPANIVVRPGNVLAFIDFGSCGHFSSRTRRLWQVLYQQLHEENVQGMTETSIAMLEPLPPIDMERFSKEVEALYWDWLYANHSEHSEWWEKAAGVMWIRLMAITRRFNVPMSLDTLRLFRATFLYNAIVFRLHAKLDLDDEYQSYFKDAGRRARKRVQKAVRRRFTRGLTTRDYMRMEALWGTCNQILNRLQHRLDQPGYSFSSMLGKTAFGVSLILQFLTHTAFAYLLFLCYQMLSAAMTGSTIDLLEASRRVASSYGYQLFLTVFLIVVIRKLRWRAEDLDNS